MKKRGLLISVSAVICIIVAILVISLASKQGGNTANTPQDIEAGILSADTFLLEDVKYDNLVIHDFKASMGEIDSLYNLKILTDTSYLDRTFMENYEIMNNVIDEFFQEEFDKSYIYADFDIGEENVKVTYDDIQSTCNGAEYNDDGLTYLFGNDIKNGGYMVQIAESQINAWFSKGGFDTIHPSGEKYNKVYPYVSCTRQVEDVDINLKDGMIKLSELEKQVLTYLNESFPLDVTKGITFGIGDARVIDVGDYQGVCFMTRRIYKGIPFEYGANTSENQYTDEYCHDSGEIDYIESTRPDTMLSFGQLTGTIVETDEIKEIIPIKDALGLLSEKIGDNSVYDVYGIEMVYRETVKRQEYEDGVDAILKPMWKVLTINQNDDKYTIFYIDVVTGDITERFEYYYE